jgi:hypothetical protein
MLINLVVCLDKKSSLLAVPRRDKGHALVLFVLLHEK